MRPDKVTGVLGTLALVGWAVVVITPVGRIFIAISVLFTLAATAYSVVQWRHHVKYARHYRRFAERHGWEYVDRASTYTARFRGYPFGFGVARHQRDIVTGTLNGAPCATFAHRFKDAPDDYRYRTFQVTLVELPVVLPRVDIVPTSMASQALFQLGGMEVYTESYEFNRRWKVRSDNRTFSLQLLDPRMIERLTWSDTEGMAIRVDGGAVMMWQQGRRDSDDLAHRLGVLTGVARRIPPHVVRDYAEQGHARDTAPRATPPTWATDPHMLTSGRYTGIEADIAPPPEVTVRGAALGVVGWVRDWSGAWIE